MPKYVVETTVARGSNGECLAHEWRVRAAVGELRREGLAVLFNRAIGLPEEGRCLFVLNARTSREAALAAERARLDGVRVLEATGVDERGNPGREA